MKKKLLYRYSFRQTLAEEESPKGYWKVVVSGIFFSTTLALLYHTFMNAFIFNEMPITYSPEFRELEQEKWLVLRKGEFMGKASKYDYENNRWRV